MDSNKFFDCVTVKTRNWPDCVCVSYLLAIFQGVSQVLFPVKPTSLDSTVYFLFGPSPTGEGGGGGGVDYS